MLKETIFQFIILFEDKNLQQLNFDNHNGWKDFSLGQHPANLQK